MSEITVAAVGDILVNGMISLSAKLPLQEGQGYDFDPIFEEVAPILREADLTIGNLETPLSGNEPFVKRRNPATGNPLFNTPEALAASLKKAGFDVLSTANNHCLDNGIEGLLRTMEVLDEHELAHTGTYASAEDAQQLLIVERNGIRVGILSYTKHTNRIPIPKAMPWCVNLLSEKRIIQDAKRLRQNGADFVILCLHDGIEYRSEPTRRQKALARRLSRSGIDMILGAHPHVLQPIIWSKENKLRAYSLGNFISIRLKGNPYTHNGIVLLIKLRKEEDGRVHITEVDHVSTWVRRSRSSGLTHYRVVPNREVAVLHSAGSVKTSGIAASEAKLMRRMRLYTNRLIRRQR